jgi:dipeptidyl aminopeptidase/acylaminoacyl peptidase
MDTDVPFEQSVMMAAELKRHGVEHRLIRIEGGPHGFDSKTEDPQVSAAFREVLAFLRGHLQP